MLNIRKRKYISRLIFIFLLIIIVPSGVVFMLKETKTPEEAIKTARENLAAARDASAGQYATKLFNEASQFYDSAMVYWQKENQRFIFLRNYSKAISFAELSSAASIESIETASHTARNAHNKTAASFESLKNNLERVGKLYGPLPINEGFRDNFNRAKLMLEESRIARSKEEFQKASEILKKAEKLLENAENTAETRMKDYFNDFSKWEKLYKQAVASSSKNNSTLIVVDKLSHELRLYKDGKMKQIFVAEFGPNWIGDKNHQGDQATPEGSYLVSTKKERRQTRYYKALLLNYPNPEDLLRYQNNVKNGLIPKHIDAGGLIEIHGHGGQGFNWTNGCVALSDRDMDVVFRHSSVNTPVIIVGSLVPYDEWQKNTILQKNHSDQ
jgi:L,D-peptidoglycan transpeptidase YkuD (ErfK/YbiS/YcfS/YnhG family)